MNGNEPMQKATKTTKIGIKKDSPQLMSPLTAGGSFGRSKIDLASRLLFSTDDNTSILQ